jgi:bifunctional non-homologous end joining protein LigD
MAKAKEPTTPLVPAEERVSLYFKDSRSDKEYHLQLLASGEAFMVYYQNGPRGGTLTNGKKTPSPVDYATAKKKYDSVVKEKTRDGYSPGEAGTTFAGTDLEARKTDLSLQLSNIISEEEAQALINDSAWLLQEKFDGQRRAAARHGAEQFGSNRKSLAVPLTTLVATALAELCRGKDIELDGEQMGDKLVVFDVLRYDGIDLRAEPCSVRLLRYLPLLAQALASAGLSGIVVAHTAVSAEEKRALYEELRSRGEEGGVFKRRDARYSPGRPATGGDHLKRKFTARDSFRVKVAHKTKRSVMLEVLGEDGVWFEVGNCTIPANYDIPVPGAVVDVEYLYAFKGGSLFQPQYKGVRNDIDEDACIASKMRFKAKTDDEEEGDN